jgi:hypothetical protein
MSTFLDLSNRRGATVSNARLALSSLKEHMYFQIALNPENVSPSEEIGDSSLTSSLFAFLSFCQQLCIFIQWSFLLKSEGHHHSS